MLKRLLASVIIATSMSSIPAIGKPTNREVSQCTVELPMGIPTIRAGVEMICRQGYLTAYDRSALIPIWVAYSTNKDRSVGCEPRSNRFYPDLSVPRDSRSEPGDYARSGYDMGHMAPAADMSWDPEALDDSMILSNISPQTPNLNRGAWKLLETHVRAWALAGRQLSIYTGGIWTASSTRIGKGVVVPDAFYKIIVDVDNLETLAFIMPNTAKVPTNLRVHLTTVAEIEARTNLIFNVARDKEKKNELWPADLKSVVQQKREECGTQ